MSNLIRRIPATETLPTLPELFGRLMGMEPVFRGWGSHFWPPVDLEERDDDIRVVSEIPGMDAKDINITVENLGHARMVFSREVYNHIRKSLT